MSAEQRWSRIAELGTAQGLRFGAWFHRHFGRGPSQFFLGLVSLYYFVRSKSARRGSRQYLELLYASPDGRAALPRRPDARMVVRHIYEFSINLYDRMVVWGGGYEAMNFRHDGSERIFDLVRAGRGALLLGAHLGSIDMLAFVSKKYRLTVNVVAYLHNAQRINEFLESLDPGAAVRVIDLDPESVKAAFEIKACIDRGELVVILADRVAPGNRGRMVQVPFFGRPASFPLGPFMLGSVIGCPMALALCLRTGSARYETIMRPLAEAGAVPRVEHEKRAREALERFVSLLEHFCREQPFQWCNFYEFWEGDGLVGRVP